MIVVVGLAALTFRFIGGYVGMAAGFVVASVGGSAWVALESRIRRR